MTRQPPVTAEDYDSLPYQSVAYAHSSPDRLAACAALFGQTPPPPETARVLELGCASGGNILPLAVRFPNARFTGVDLSRGQVDEGARRVAALGLSNIEIKYGDIAELDLPEASFDYIILHGVWSWIPEAAREAVFAIARRCLVPGGLMYVSYNTLPGWHLRQTVRDLCTYHAGTEGGPERRVARARWLLEKLGETKGKSLYAELFRHEAASNARQPDSYILGEFLADHNTPVYFSDFAERAQSHGLAFLCEADIGSSIPETLPPETARMVREIAGSSGLALEQYMDFFTGRQFRKSILIQPPEDGKQIARSLSPKWLIGLHLASVWQPSTDTEGAWTDGQRTMTPEPVERAVLDALHKANPASLPVASLVQAILSGGSAPSESAVMQTLNRIFRLTLNPGFELLAVPRRSGRASDPMPEVCPLARHEAAIGQKWLSSRRHAPVTLPQGVQSLLPYFDGTRDIATIGAMVSDAIATGGLSRGGQAVGDDMDPTARTELAHGIVKDLLKRLELAGLLVEPETN